MEDRVLGINLIIDGISYPLTVKASEEPYYRQAARMVNEKLSLYKPIILKKGCLVGMESFVMPGVTIGEGAVVGAGSMVTKDIPAWSVAVGRPAKVVRQIPQREGK